MIGRILRAKHISDRTMNILWFPQCGSDRGKMRQSCWLIYQVDWPWFHPLTVIHNRRIVRYSFLEFWRIQTRDHFSFSLLIFHRLGSAPLNEITFVLRLRYHLARGFPYVSVLRNNTSYSMRFYRDCINGSNLSPFRPEPSEPFVRQRKAQSSDDRTSSPQKVQQTHHFSGRHSHKPDVFYWARTMASHTKIIYYNFTRMADHSRKCSLSPMTNLFQDIATMTFPAIEEDTISEHRKSHCKYIHSWWYLAFSKHIPVV
jgi:hypothetical protein